MQAMHEPVGSVHTRQILPYARWYATKHKQYTVLFTCPSGPAILADISAKANNSDPSSAFVQLMLAQACKQGYHI